MPVYVYDSARDCMVNKATGEPDAPKSVALSAPRVFGDYEGYQSPIDGSWIEGRRARQYDMEKNGCVDANDFTPAGGRGFKNERFAKKHGLEHLMK